MDTGPLGLVTHLRAERNAEAVAWLKELNAGGARVRVPEICDYELRRELLRRGATTGIRRLDDLGRQVGYVPITTEAFRLAAELWARARREGYSTAADPALDADVILAAQASLLATGGDDVVVATTNVAHISRFVAAEKWQEITPRAPDPGAGLY
jgi:predicted nucleic acid-binding protein